jgi:hypothetical protein
MEVYGELSMTEEEALANAAAETVRMRLEPDDIRVNPELHFHVADNLRIAHDEIKEIYQHPNFNPTVHGHPMHTREFLKNLRLRLIGQYQTAKTEEAKG